jgi:hypothetical protein
MPVNTAGRGRWDIANVVHTSTNQAPVMMTPWCISHRCQLEHPGSSITAARASASLSYQPQALLGGTHMTNIYQRSTTPHPAGTLHRCTLPDCPFQLSRSTPKLQSASHPPCPEQASGDQALLCDTGQRLTTACRAQRRRATHPACVHLGVQSCQDPAPHLAYHQHGRAACKTTQDEYVSCSSATC